MSTDALPDNVLSLLKNGKFVSINTESELMLYGDPVVADYKSQVPPWYVL